MQLEHELGDLLYFEQGHDRPKISLNTLDIKLSSNFTSVVRIHNMAIRNLRISNTMRPMLQISDCWIELLTIRSGPINVNIVGSHMAYMVFGSDGLGNLTIRESSISAVQLESLASPIRGTVVFDKLVTPRGVSWYQKRPCGSDQWDRIKKQLALSGNEWAAGVFHATEMSIRSREDSSTLVRRIGKFYEDACDYGNSVGRSIFWMVFFFFFFWGVYALFEPASPSIVADDASCVGWINNLCGEDGWARFWRTLYLSAQPLLNPLAGITGVSVVTPGGPAYVLSIFHRILALVLIFLMIVAIRRRFRLSVE
jgi:hypothetical protein